MIVRVICFIQTFLISVSYYFSGSIGFAITFMVVSSTLRCRVSLGGNAMHVANVGCVLAVALACLEDSAS